MTVFKKGKIKAGENIEAESDEIDKILEASIFIENSEDEIRITFPAKYMRERLSEKQIQVFLDEIGIIIYQSLQLKIEQCKPHKKRWIK